MDDEKINGLIVELIQSGMVRGRGLAYISRETSHCQPVKAGLNIWKDWEPTVQLVVWYFIFSLCTMWEGENQGQYQYQIKDSGDYILYFFSCFATCAFLA